MKNYPILIVGVLLAFSGAAHSVGKQDMALHSIPRAVHRARMILHQCVPPKTAHTEQWVMPPSPLQTDEPMGYVKDTGSPPKNLGRGLALAGANR